MSLRVVLVDDDAGFRATARRALVADGIDVVAEVEDGEGALGAVTRWQPDVVLVDIGLPGIDGVEVARRLRGDAAGSVVILISTRDVAAGWRPAWRLATCPKNELFLDAILALTPPAARPGRTCRSRAPPGIRTQNLWIKRAR